MLRALNTLLLMAVQTGVCPRSSLNGVAPAGLFPSAAHKNRVERRMPLTLAIPTRNRRDRVTRLVHQIVPQLRSGDELIVSDDASSDGTAAALTAIPCVQVRRHDSALGMVGNWNYCLKAGSNEWVCLVHDDDQLMPRALEAIRAVALPGRPALIVHAEWEGGSLVRRLRALRGWEGAGIIRPPRVGVSFTLREPGPQAALLAEFCPSGATLHRSLVERLGGFDPLFRYSADMEYFPRICARCPSYIIRSPRIVKYVRHDQQYSMETWLREDFLDELERVQRASIAHAGLDAARAAAELERRMVRDMSHMLRSLRGAGNTRQVRGIARALGSRPGLPLRHRVAAGIGTRLGWYPRCLV